MQAVNYASIITSRLRPAGMTTMTTSSMLASDATSISLAAAHLELVLAVDYQEAGASELVFRSRLSAASSFWRAGQLEQAQTLFEAMIQTHPEKAAIIRQIRADLQQEYSARTS